MFTSMRLFVVEDPELMAADGLYLPLVRRKKRTEQEPFFILVDENLRLSTSSTRNYASPQVEKRKNGYSADFQR